MFFGSPRESAKSPCFEPPKRQSVFLAGTNDSFHALRQERYVEVQQQTELELGGSQIGNYLRGVNRCELVDRLYFDDEAIVDDEVEAGLPDQLPFEQDAHGRLTPEWDLTAAQLPGERLLVHAFQEARSEVPVDLDAGADHLAGTPVCLRAWLPPKGFGVLAVHIRISDRPRLR